MCSHHLSSKTALLATSLLSIIMPCLTRPSNEHIMRSHSGILSPMSAFRCSGAYPKR